MDDHTLKTAHLDPEPRTRRQWIAAPLVLAALLATAAPTRAAGPGRTTVTVFEPFAARGAIALSLHVVAIASGSCNGDSEVTSRVDAWRCFSDKPVESGNIFDPCLQDRTGYNTVLVCTSDGLSPDVVLMHLTAPLPTHFGKTAPTRASALGVTLMSGERCGILGGAGEVLGDLRLNYICGGAHPTVSLYGEVDRTHQPYTILAYRGPLARPTLKQLVRVPLRAIVV